MPGGGLVARSEPIDVDARADHSHPAAVDAQLERLVGDVAANCDHPIGRAQIRRHQAFDRGRVVLAEQTVGGDNQR